MMVAVRTIDRVSARDAAELQKDVHHASVHGISVGQVQCLRWNWNCVADHSAYRDFDDFVGRWLRRRTSPAVSDLLASADAISAAIDALPVGRDFRQRLQARVARHVEAVSAFATVRG